MGLPTISVEFKKLASTALIRSTRGVLAVILQDATSADWTSKTYTSVSEVESKEFTESNYKALARAFTAGPYQVIAVRVGNEDTMDTAKAILDKLNYNWVCAVPTGFQAGLVAYVKSINTPQRVKKVKALVYNQASADNDHVVSVANSTVTLHKETSPTAMNLYLPRLAGLLAACPMDQSVTYAALEDLDAAADVDNLNSTIDDGNLCLFQDDDVVRIARGVNTLQTITGDATEDMKKIAVVEAMDLIQEDVIRTFKVYYLGKKKNTPDNQALFVSDVLTYLNTLASEDVLNPDETISAEVDVAAMRTAWGNAGSPVTDLTDEQVKKKTFRSKVFVAAQARILDAMEDMTMVFTMG